MAAAAPRFSIIVDPMRSILGQKIRAHVEPNGAFCDAADVLLLEQSNAALRALVSEFIDEAREVASSSNAANYELEKLIDLAARAEDAIA